MACLFSIVTLYYPSLLLLLLCSGVSGSTFTFINTCNYTVWPGILSNSGSPLFNPTGFELPVTTSISIQAPNGWSGRFWARTGCTFDASGAGKCQTGDCGANLVCANKGAVAPVTLIEFTLSSNGDKDFYDVSLVDGYNLPVLVVPSLSTATAGNSCASTGCAADLNSLCPTELKTENGHACNSACVAFGKPEYCCTETYGSPKTCLPSEYSKIFKTACPSSYSYAYDDMTSTFTCANADYTITFCPSSASLGTIPTVPTTTTPNSGFSGEGDGNDMGGESRVSGSSSGSEVTTDESWLAGLAMGDSTITASPTVLWFSTIVLSLILCSIYL